MSSVNVAYKHLEHKLRIGEFTVGQWGGLFFGVMAALTWGTYISPFGSSLTLISAVYIGGLPVGAAFLASMTEIDFWLHVRALSRHRRAIGRYVPGPGHNARGYVLTDDTADAVYAPDAMPNLDLQALWD